MSRCVALAALVAPAGAAVAFPGSGVQRLSDAPSRNPAISQDRRFGRLAAFEADTGGTTNVLVVRRAEPSGAPGNGPSGAPSLTAGGTWVVFDSAASDVGVTTSRGPDTNCVRDAMISTEPSGDRWLLGEGTAEATTNPMTSPHGNYIVFERDGHAQLLYVGAR